MNAGCHRVLRAGFAHRYIAAALLAAVLLPAGPSARAQEGVGQVNGTVLDKDRKGVAGLAMALIPKTGPTISGTTTDESGRYAFKGLAADTYSVLMRLPSGGVARKDGIRVRPLFRSIVDFNVATDVPAGSIPAPLAAAPPSVAAPGSTAPAPGDPPGDAGFSLACALAGPDREPVPDAVVTLTPVSGRGRLRRARTGPDGGARIDDVPAGDYRIAARAAGFMSWSLGPIALSGPGGLRLSLSMVPFPMGFPGTLEDLLIPAEPIPPSTRQ